MNDKQVRDLATLRNFVIAYYKSLTGPNDPGSMTKTQDVALTCESIINSMDDLLREYVKFE